MMDPKVPLAPPAAAPASFRPLNADVKSGGSIEDEELEKFRKQWRDEVNAKAKGVGGSMSKAGAREDNHTQQRLGSSVIDVGRGRRYGGQGQGEGEGEGEGKTVAALFEEQEEPEEEDDDDEGLDVDEADGLGDEDDIVEEGPVAQVDEDGAADGAQRHNGMSALSIGHPSSQATVNEPKTSTTAISIPIPIPTPTPKPTPTSSTTGLQAVSSNAKAQLPSPVSPTNELARQTQAMSLLANPNQTSSTIHSATDRAYRASTSTAIGAGVGSSTSTGKSAVPRSSGGAGPGPGSASSNAMASSSTGIGKVQNQSPTTTTTITTKERAVQIYSRAVESEQSGKLNDALMLYRRACKLDDDVDRLYARSITKSSASAWSVTPAGGLSKSPTSIKSSSQAVSSTPNLPPTPTSTDIVSSAPPSLEPYSFARHIQVQPDYVKPPSPAPTTASTSNTNTNANTSANAEANVKPEAHAGKHLSLPSSTPSKTGYGHTLGFNHNNGTLSGLSHPSVISPLTKLLSSLPITPAELTFLPQEEDLPCPIAQLPNELFEPILDHLDVASIERFGSVCWKARYLTHVSFVWRKIAQRIYRPPAMIPLPPQVVDPDTLEYGEAEGIEAAGRDLTSNNRADIVKIIGNPAPSAPGSGISQKHKAIDVNTLVSRHGGEWRTTVVEEERVRMDGCYIAVCHYIRPGAGEEWVSVTHMITYHRFLRFYPDGYVISFLTTDHPSETVPLLKPSLRGKGLHFGRWKLLRSDSHQHPSSSSSSSSGASGGAGARVIITDLLEPGNQTPKYEFEMDLALKSTGRGRWNKLDIIKYRSINLMTGEVLGLPLKHQKPFYFSKVRSYNPPF